MIDYPDELLRGISNNNQEFITAEGYPTQAAFRFDEYNPELRNDGYRELSVNWVDDEGAVEMILNQINVSKHCLQFKGGYCRFSRSTILIAMKHFIDNGHLSFERQPIEKDEENEVKGNPYHGNILMKKDLSKSAVTNIQVTLAGLAGMVMRREIE